jgi:hypothetical protein
MRKGNRSGNIDFPVFIALISMGITLSLYLSSITYELAQLNKNIANLTIVIQAQKTNGR